MNQINLKNISTEGQNKNTFNIDRVSTIEAVNLFIEEDFNIYQAIKNENEHITKAIDLVTDNIKNGGRVFYVGAGTSGRIASLDAIEIPANFGLNNVFFTIMAGGEKAIIDNSNDFEDDPSQSQKDLEFHNLSKKDVVIAISASGRSPFVVGALEYAKKIGSATISIDTSIDTKISKISDVAISVKAGPEVIVGSTRLKSGTVQKMVLNMISTISMTKLGRVYHNYMIGVKPSNKKLIERSIKIITSTTNVSYEKAKVILEEANMDVKLALIAIKKKVNIKEAQKNQNIDLTKI